MPSMIDWRTAAVLAAVSLGALGCKGKVTTSECDALVTRYAQLVVTEKFPDASADRIVTEQARELGEARGDDAFKNCQSEVTRSEFDCAMTAPTADALEKCLE